MSEFISLTDTAPVESNEAPVVIEEAVPEVVVEEVVIEETPAEVVIEKSVEDQAREKNWRPKEEWTGDPEDWVDATEFVARGPFIKQIIKQKRTLKQQEETLKEVLKTLSQSEDRAYKKALKDIESGKLRAKQERNVDAYEHYLNQEKNLSTEYNEKMISTTNVDTTNILETKEFKEFTLTDPYILKANDPKFGFAVRTAQDLSNEWARLNPGVKDAAAEIGYIKTQMRKIHSPDRFPELYTDVSPTTSKIAPVKGGTTTSKPVSTISTAGLNSDQIRCMNNLKRDGLDWKTYVKNEQLNK